MTDYRLPMHQGPPRRKPVANLQHGYSFQSYDTPPSHQLAPHPPPPSLAHNRTRTSSSTVLPYSASQQYQPAPAQHQMTPPVNYPPTRRLSSAATSTSSGGNNHGTYPPPHPDLRRSTSSRSANAQLGYVGLLRRQKATVWCDRAQAEDPRLRAQKMAEKKRAYLEVHGAGAGRSATLGSGKVKHSGKGTTDFSPSTLVGGAVPVRLSANEVGDADEDAHSDDIFHRRPGSGRSSLGSANRFPSGYQRPQGNSSPPNEKTDLPEVSENSPANPPANPVKPEEEKPSAEDERRGSIQEENFDVVPDMQAPSAAMTAVQKAQKAEELRRRGSVDDRSTSMTGVRLFVANPDLSD